jgi:hypothetical protein
MYPFLIQGKNVVVVIGNKSHTISSTHISYQKVIDAIKANDWDTVKDVIDPKKVVLNYGKGNVAIQGDKLYWMGEELASTLAVRMIKMYQEGFPIEPMVNFMENLMQNPSKRAVNELYGFLDKNQLPITPDGYILAYKKVRENYMDVHSGTVLNKPASVLTDADRELLNKPVKGVTVTVENGVTVVSMERNQVDDDKDRTCSTGLHFCGMSYLDSFGGNRTVIVKVNPRDVVSIPSDHNEAKGRACRYEVIGELNVEPEKAFDKPVQVQANTNRPTKTGSTAFYQGYTDGYHGRVSPRTVIWTQDMNEGYEKGRRDAQEGRQERYRYVAPSGVDQKVVANGLFKMNPSSSWPDPK